MQIYSSLNNDLSFEEIEKEFDGKGYGDFKRAVADSVCELLESIQTKYKEICESDIIEKTLKDGAEKANIIANAKVQKVQKAIGMEIVK